jgi:hypothetical protein
MLLIIAFVVAGESVNAQAKSNKYLTVNYFGSGHNPFEGRYYHFIEFRNITQDQQLLVQLECDGNTSLYWLSQYEIAGTVDFNPNSQQAKKVKITILNVPNTPTITLVLNNIHYIY